LLKILVFKFFRGTETFFISKTEITPNFDIIFSYVTVPSLSKSVFFFSIRKQKECLNMLISDIIVFNTVLFYVISFAKLLAHFKS